MAINWQSLNPFRRSAPAPAPAPAPVRRDAPLQPGQQGPVRPQPPSGTIVLTPTGGQSRATPLPNPLTPTRPSGGGTSGSSGGGGSSGSSRGGGQASPSTPIQGPLQPGTQFTPTGGVTKVDTAKQVESFAQQVKIQDELAKQQEKVRQQRIASDAFLGGARSSASDAFGPVSEVKRLQEKQKSVKPPTEASLRFLRGDTGYRESGGIREEVAEFREILTTNPQISAETANLALKGIKDQEVAKAYLEAQNNQIKIQQQSAQQNFNAKLQSQEVLDYKQRLQDRINSGEDVNKINKEWADYQDKIANEVNRKAEKDYDSWFKGYQEGEGKNIQQQALRDLIKFNSRYGAPRAKEILKDTIKPLVSGVAVGAGTSAVIGGLGLFRARGLQVAKAIASKVVKTAASTPVIATGALAGIVTSLGIQGKREKDLQRQYGFSKEEAQRIATLEGKSRLIKGTAEFAGFTAGAIAGSTIVSSGLSQYKTMRVNIKKEEFIKELGQNPKLQEKYFTDANLKKGYIIKNIEGAKVKIPISQSDVAKIYGAREGIVTERTSTSLGINEQLSIENKIKNDKIIQMKANELGIDLDRGVNIAKLKREAFTRLTHQKIGREENSWQVSVRSGNEVRGLIFKETASGKITSVRPYRQQISPSQGTSLIESFKEAPRKETKKLDMDIEVSGETVGKSELFATKVKFTGSAQQEGKPLRLTNFDLAIAKIKGRASKAESIFGKSRETIEEAMKSKRVIAIDTNVKPEITQVGSGRRVSLIKDIEIFGNKGSKETFIEKVKTRTPEKLIDILPPQKEAKGAKGKSIGVLRENNIKPTEGKKNNEGNSLINLEKPKEEALQILQETAGTSLIPEVKTPKSPDINLKAEVIKEAPKSESGRLFSMGFGIEESNKRQESLFGLESNQMGEQLFVETNKNRESLFFAPESIFKISSKTSSAQQQQMMQQQINLQQPILPIKPSPELKMKPIQPPPEGGLGLGGFLGELEVGGGQKGVNKGTSLFGGTKYSASLGSILLRRPKLRVTKSQAKKLAKETYSGLELRPELEIVGEKKPKKRKSLFAI